jgi:hypothetical protein
MLTDRTHPGRTFAMTQPQFPPPYPNYPTMPYSSPPPARPTSVSVLAIIGIILAAIAVLCAPFALVPYFVKMPGPPNPLIDEVKNNSTIMAYMVFATAASWVLGVVLAAGAIGSLSLKRWARKTMLGYAWGATVLAIVGLIFSFAWMIPMAQRAVANTPAASQGAAIGGVIGGIFGAVMGLAYPLCVLYFYTRQNVIAAFAAETTQRQA